MTTLNTDVNCTLCNKMNLETMVDFGLQPLSNRFVTQAMSEHTQEMHPLALGYCQDCGTTQLTARMPIESIRPRYSWLNYNEPEGHLDAIAQQLARLPNIGSESRILGLTYKDQSTINRLAKLGLSNGMCMSEQDFDFSADFFGLETIQQLLRNSATITKIKEKKGLADIVLLRHIIEHTDNAADLLRHLKALITPDGYIVLELPDSEQIFKNGNHPFIWEEHISYFTEQSLTKLAAAVGADLAWFQRCHYPYEDSLLVAFRFSADTQQQLPVDENTQVKDKLKKFGSDLEMSKKAWRKNLLHYKNQGNKVAVFGAGHLAVKFINFLNLSDLIDCVIDDNPNKIGMRMPGSLLSIIPSAEIAERGIRVCISTLSPESEIKVRQKLLPYFNTGGIFLPAFTMTSHST